LRKSNTKVRYHSPRQMGRGTEVKEEAKTRCVDGNRLDEPCEGEENSQVCPKRGADSRRKPAGGEKKGGKGGTDGRQVTWGKESLLIQGHNLAGWGKEVPMVDSGGGERRWIWKRKTGRRGIRSRDLLKRPHGMTKLHSKGWVEWGGGVLVVENGPRKKLWVVEHGGGDTPT